jgi:precorrin-6B methylase 2
MSKFKTKKDRHFPAWFFDNIFRRIFSNPRTFNARVEPHQVVVDLGSGPGFYTFPLADRVGSDGRVYAIDSDDKQIQAIGRKVKKRNIPNVEAHVSSAAQLDFIQTDSVDFVLANGLLC